MIAGAGYDFFDVGAAIKRGVPVGHTPGCLSETVADFASVSYSFDTIWVSRIFELFSQYEMYLV